MLHPNRAPAYPGEERGIPRTRLIREMSEAARLKLHKLTETLLGGDVIATVSVRAGRPDGVILREAGLIRADLIIMGGRTGSFWARLFSPGVLKRVLRRSRCPVLVIGGADSECLTPRNRGLSPSVGVADFPRPFACETPQKAF